MRRFSNVYGSRPAHLLVLLACFALAGYSASFLLGDPTLLRVLVWFVGAAVVHDLVLFPLYALADRVLGRLNPPARHRVPLVNHVRVPLLGAGLTFLVFLPGIIRQGEGAHRAATGLDQAPYLGRWLWLVAAMVTLSALVYAVRLVRQLRRSRAATRAQSTRPTARPASCAGLAPGARRAGTPRARQGS